MAAVSQEVKSGGSVGSRRDRPRFPSCAAIGADSFPARLAVLKHDGESGQIMILSLAYALIALALVLVVASASAVHIERKQLLALADAAALDAADAVDLDLFYGDHATPRGSVPLTDSSVRSAVERHLVRSPSSARLRGLAIAEPTGTPDGVTAEVSLRARARPPFVPWVLIGWADGVPLHVTSSARAGGVL